MPLLLALFAKKGAALAPCCSWGFFVGVNWRCGCNTRFEDAEM